MYTHIHTSLVNMYVFFFKQQQLREYQIPVVVNKHGNVLKVCINDASSYKLLNRKEINVVW